MTATPKKDGEKSGRDQRGRFADGNPGGPGRPRGRGRSDLLLEALKDDLPAIFDTLRQQALAGDAAALRLVVDKIIPSPKAIEEPVPIALPDGSLTEQGRALLRACAAGEIAPGQAASLVGALGQLARVSEMDELDARIRKLEEANAKP